MIHPASTPNLRPGPFPLSGRVLLTGLVLAAVGCGGDGGTTPTGRQPTSITVQPASKRLLVGNQVQLSATVLDQDGQVMAGQTVNWTSSDENVATVDGAGRVTATGGGQATINARTPRTTGGNVTGTAQIDVPVPDGTVGPGGGQVADGASATVLQVPAGALGSTLSITIVPAPEPGGSLPSDPSAGTVVQGTVFELGPQSAQFSPAATLTIGYNPATLPSGTFEGGLRMYRSSGTSSWAPVNGSVVDTDARVVRAPVTGFSIYALVARPNEAPTVTISQPAANATVQRGESVTFQGSATDPEDGTLTGASLVWTSSIDGEIGTGTSFSISSLSEGVHTVTLTATDSEGATGTDERTLTVEAAPQLITLSLGETSSSSIQVGDRLLLPLLLDMSDAGGIQIARLELRVSFDLILLGAESWSLGQVDFSLVLDETELDGSSPIARAVFVREADFGASAMVGQLVVDAAAVGSATVGVEVLEAYDPGGQPVTGVVTRNHQVSIAASDPPVQTLQPGNGAGNTSGGVLYFRVPVPATAAAPASTRDPGTPARLIVPGGRGLPRPLGGRDLTRPPGPFEAVAGRDALQIQAPHLQTLTRALDDALPGPGPDPASVASGQTLRIRIRGGTGDADLYVRQGALPTVNVYDCRPFQTGNEETCDAVDPVGGDWFVMLRQFGFAEFTGVTLETALYDAVAVATPGLPYGVLGAPYGATLQARDGDGTYEWSVTSGELPPGLVLDPDGGFGGTPTAVGDYTFTVQVVSAGKAATMGYTLSILPTALPLGYVFARNGQEASYTPDAGDYENLAAGTVEIVRTGTGLYTVTFNGMGIGVLGSSFTAMVNSVADFENTRLSQGGPACRLGNLNANPPLRAFVVCEDPQTGGAVDARYRVLVVGNGVLGGPDLPGQEAAFSLHNQLGATSSYTPNSTFAWNSDGAAQTVTPQAGGVIRHTMGTSMSTPYSAFVSTVDLATGGAGNACTLANGTGSYLDVQCLSRAGGTVDRIHLVLQLQKGRPDAPWGYAYVVQGTGLNPTYSASSAGSIDVQSQGTGRWRITFNGIALAGTPAITVTPVAVGSSWTYCSHFRSASDPITVDVACYGSTGSFSDRSFFVLMLR